MESCGREWSRRVFKALSVAVFLRLGFEMRVWEGAGFPRLLEEAALE